MHVNGISIKWAGGGFKLQTAQQRLKGTNYMCFFFNTEQYRYFLLVLVLGASTVCSSSEIGRALATQGHKFHPRKYAYVLLVRLVMGL